MNYSKKRESIHVLIIGVDDFSWYKKFLGKKLKVFKDKIIFNNVLVYENIEGLGVIFPNHCLTNFEQREKKIKKVLKK